MENSGRSQSAFHLVQLSLMGMNINRQIWISLSIIVGSLILAAAAIYFMSLGIASTVNKIVADRAVVEQQASALGIIAALKSQEPQANVYAAAMDSVLPTQSELLQFSPWIQKIAQNDSVTVQVAFEGTSVPSGENIPGNEAFSLTINGSLNEIADFLSDIETKQPGFLLNITSYDLTYQNSDYQMAGQGVAYFK
jgi:hypothetical protein